MDFLISLTIYILIFGISAVCVVYRDSPAFQTGLLGWLRKLVIEIYSRLVPQFLQTILYNTGHYLLFRRHPAFQFLFGTLVLLGHAVFVVDMLPLLQFHEPQSSHVLVPALVLFINFYFFHLSCTRDAGVINKRNFERYKSVYKYDGRMYQEDVKCRTCDFVKPARSKHCSVCDHCVHRFDHHCIWTNRCVGGLNQCYFVLFLISLLVMIVEGIYVSGRVLNHYVKYRRLMKASYMDSDGNMKPMTLMVLFQHLFMQFPRLVFLIASCCVLLCLLGGFTIYHINLVITNQTTNELYKKNAQWTTSGENRDKSETNSDKTVKNSDKIGRNSDRSVTGTPSRNPGRPYDRGVFENIIETFFPDHFICKRIKQNK